MHANHVNPQLGQPNRDSNGPTKPIHRGPPTKFGNEALSRRADQQGLAKVQKAVTPGNKQPVMLMGLAESNARIEADSCRLDPRGYQPIPPRREVSKDLTDHVVIAGIVLHILRGPANVHRTHAALRLGGQVYHLLESQAGDIVDDFRA